MPFVMCCLTAASPPICRFIHNRIGLNACFGQKTDSSFSPLLSSLGMVAIAFLELVDVAGSSAVVLSWFSALGARLLHAWVSVERRCGAALIKAVWRCSASAAACADLAGHMPQLDDICHGVCISVMSGTTGSTAGTGVKDPPRRTYWRLATQAAVRALWWIY